MAEKSSIDEGLENRGYARSQSENQLTPAKDIREEDLHHIRRLLRTTSAAASTFPSNQYSTVDLKDTTDSWKDERNVTLLDPMSDRVSTILVWQNITVSTREKKKKFWRNPFQTAPPSEPEKKDLLHGVSGAITGGLWAVIGESTSDPFATSSSTDLLLQVRLVQANRLC